MLSTSYKFFLDELLAILKLREKNDGIKLAMLIIYARASKDDEVESIRKSINFFLSKQGWNSKQWHCKNKKNIW